MLLHLLLVFFLAPAFDEVADLIAEYRALPRDRAGERLALLDRIGGLEGDGTGDAAGGEGVDSDGEAKGDAEGEAKGDAEGEERCEAVGDRVAAFLAHVMEKDPDESARARAFFHWACRNPPQAVADFLDARRRTGGLGTYIEVIPDLTGFDRLGYLKSLYDDRDMARLKKETARALARLGGGKAFEFLEKKIERCGSYREVNGLLAALHTMEASREPAFLERLMKSRHPFVRADGARRLVRDGRDPGLEKAGRFLETEAHPRVRREVMDEAAQLGTAEAVRLILGCAASQPDGHHHQIVELLAKLPPRVVKNAVPEDWFAESDPLRFKVLALAFTSSDGFMELVGREDRIRLRRAQADLLPGVPIVSAVACHRLEPRNAKAEFRVKTVLGMSTLDMLWETMDTVRTFRLDDPVIVEKFLTFLHGKSWELRLEAARVLGSLGVEAAVPHLKKCLENRNLLLRIAAVRALGSIGTKESVSLLVERLRREEGRAAWEIVRSLSALTGRDFGIDAGQWRTWWKTGAAAYHPPRKGERPWAAEAGDGSRYGFYGLSIDSRHIVFVLDVSNSMGGGRIKRLRTELTSTLMGLNSEYAVNLIFFNHRVTRWQENLVPCGEEGRRDYKAEALERVAALEAGGNTNLYGALKAALDDEEVDAVVLLSDGDPTAGKVKDKEALVELVKEWNRYQQAAIHVVALGGADRNFLRRLALCTGGTFRSL